MTGENARQMATYMPNSYEYKFKGNYIRFHMEGGLTAGMLGDILIDTKKGEAWMIKPSEKTVYTHSETEKKSAKPSITATNETLNILGYRCKKYKVSTPTDQGTLVQYVWATTDIEIPQPLTRGKRTPTDAQQLLIEGLDGFPLKIMTTVPVGGFIMVMTASKIDLSATGKNRIHDPPEIHGQRIGCRHVWRILSIIHRINHFFMKSHSLLLLFIFIGFSSTIWAKSRPSIDIVHYAFQLQLHDNSDHIDGIAEIQLRFLTPGQYTVELDLTSVILPPGKE